MALIRPRKRPPAPAPTRAGRSPVTNGVRLRPYLPTLIASEREFDVLWHRLRYTIYDIRATREIERPCCHRLRGDLWSAMPGYCSEWRIDVNDSDSFTAVPAGTRSDDEEGS